MIELVEFQETPPIQCPQLTLHQKAQLKSNCDLISQNSSPLLVQVLCSFHTLALLFIALLQILPPLLCSPHKTIVISDY